MKNISIKSAVLIISIIALNVYSYAQESLNPAQGCANVTLYQIIGNDTVDITVDEINDGMALSCDTASRKLYAVGFAPGQPHYDTGYVIEKIKYDPPAEFTSGSKLALPADDCWGQLMNFDYYFPPDEENGIPPFQFRFYDKTYTTIAPNSNGGIHFYDENSPLWGKLKNEKPTSSNYVSCPYATSQAFPDKRTDWGSYPSPVLNSINGPFQDIHYAQASGSGGLYINMVGEYPCRMVIFSINEIPMYGNTSQKNTSMIVLYETTNVIEFYIKKKPKMTSTNNSNAILGMQNVDGTIAHTITNPNYAPNGGTPTVQSYNNKVWEASEEAWRIKPSDEIGGQLVWYMRPTDGPNKGDSIPLSTTTPKGIVTDGETANTLIAKPDITDGPTWYYCSMVVTRLEDSREFSVTDSVLVIPHSVPVETLTHVSESNQITAAYSQNSSSYYDTVCVGDKIKFTLTGGDEYSFVEPIALADKYFNNGVCIIDPQDASVESVKYVFKILNYKDGELVCTRYDSCEIFNRQIKTSIGEDTNLCRGELITYYDREVKDDGYEYNYSWLYGGSLGQSEVGKEAILEYAPKSSGKLTLNVVDVMGCAASDDVEINVFDAPEVSIDGQRDICKGSATTLTAVSSVKNSSFEWNDPAMTSTAKLTVSPNVTTKYTVSVGNPNADCITTAEATVTVVEYPTIYCIDDQRMCDGEMSSIAVSGTADRFVWESLDASINGATGKVYDVAPDATTKYTVHAYNNDTLNCESTADMTVFVSPKPVIDIRFSPDIIDELTPQIMFADSTVGVTERLWELSDGSTYTEKIFMHVFDIDDSTQTYNVTLTGRTDDGCTDSASRVLAVRRDYHLYAPTGVYLHDFNESNRTFKIHINNLNTFSLKVFDRWGTLLWETNDPELAWDCKYKGENVNQGVYTWIAQYSHLDNPKREIKKTGTFMIFN